MEKTKKTQKEMFEVIKGLLSDNMEVVNFCNERIAMLAKKAGSKSKADIEEDAELKVMLATELAKIGKAVTITELMKASEVIMNTTFGKDKRPLSNQKISALLKTMDNVTKVTDKKKTFFSITD